MSLVSLFIIQSVSMVRHLVGIKALKRHLYLVTYLDRPISRYQLNTWAVRPSLSCASQETTSPPLFRSSRYMLALAQQRKIAYVSFYLGLFTGWCFQWCFTARNISSISILNFTRFTYPRLLIHYFCVIPSPQTLSLMSHHVVACAQVHLENKKIKKTIEEIQTTSKLWKYNKKQ